jgi:hypothetical protein
MFGDCDADFDKSNALIRSATKKMDENEEKKSGCC